MILTYQATTDWECRHCRRNWLILITGEDETAKNRWGRLVCAHCEVLIQWIKNPALLPQIKARRRAIDKILRKYTGYLNLWEKCFLKGVQHRTYLGLAEQWKLNEIGRDTIGRDIAPIEKPQPMRAKAVSEK